MRQSTAKLAIVEPHPSPNRQGLADAKARLAELNEQTADIQAVMRLKDEARLHLAAVEAEWRDFLVEDELSDNPNTGRRAALKAAVKRARAKASDTGQDGAALELVQGEALAANREVTAAHLAIVTEEGRRLAEAYWRHAGIAARYLQGAEALRFWATHRTDNGPTVGVAISHAINGDGDSQRAMARRTALHDASQAYGALWAAFPEQLAADPAATIADPEA